MLAPNQQDPIEGLRHMIAAALAAKVSPAAIENLILAANRNVSGGCPECGSTMRSEARLRRCSSCGITTASSSP